MFLKIEQRRVRKQNSCHMKIGSHQWIDLIIEGAAQMGLAISPQQASQFARHAEILLEWNRKINLTTIVDPVAVAVKHFLDAIAPLEHIPSGGELLDIGTGGGFPGIPLKIMHPEQPMILIDGVRKKINFVKHVIRQLHLAEIEAMHIRSEELTDQASYQKRFKVIVCRALADLNAVIHMASPLLAASGRIIAFQGPQDASQSQDNLYNSHVRSRHHHFNLSTVDYHLPILGDPRSIVVIESIN